MCVCVCTPSEPPAARTSLSLLPMSGMKLRLSRLYHRVHLSSEQLTSARLIWAPACRGRQRQRGFKLTLFSSDDAHRRRTSTHQTRFAARLVVADVDPQRLLPQCALGYLHAKHLVDLSNVLRQIAACSEEAAGGLDTGQHGHTHITAAHTHKRQPLHKVLSVLNALKAAFLNEHFLRWDRTHIFWSAGRQRAPQLDSCMMERVKRCSLVSYRKASCTCEQPDASRSS